jgi:hypothetical protein
MSQRPETTFIALALIALLALPAAAQQAARQQVPADAAERRALHGTDLDDLMLVLEREYRLWTLYDRAIGELGAREPLLTVRREQERRLRRVTALYAAHGLAVPDNPWLSRLAPPADLGAACLAGFRGELEIEGLYAAMSDRTERDHLASTYRAAGRESQSRLEALRDCALEGEI